MRPSRFPKTPPLAKGCLFLAPVPNPFRLISNAVHVFDSDELEERVETQPTAGAEVAQEFVSSDDGWI